MRKNSGSESGPERSTARFRGPALASELNSISQGRWAVKTRDVSPSARTDILKLGGQTGSGGETSKFTRFGEEPTLLSNQFHSFGSKSQTSVPIGNIFSPNIGRQFYRYDSRAGSYWFSQREGSDMSIKSLPTWSAELGHLAEMTHPRFDPLQQ